MAFKANGVVIVSDTRDLTLTSDTCMTRNTGNVEVTSTGLAGSGYAIGGNKVFTSAGTAFANVVFDNSAFLCFPLGTDQLTPQQGLIAGYQSGGNNPSGTPPVNVTTDIDKFSFASESTTSDVGELTVVRQLAAGASSSTHGYNLAGGAPPSICFGGLTDIIEKFPFSSDTNASDVGETTRNMRYLSSASSSTAGFMMGGTGPSPSVTSNQVECFPFSSDTDSSDLGELNSTRQMTAGNSSKTHGYTAGGYCSPPVGRIDIIEKFNFSGTFTATDVGELSQARQGAAGSNSDTSGYASGGFFSPPSAYISRIDKYPFANDAPGTNIGNLTEARFIGTGTSSDVNGYVMGGNPGSSPSSDGLEKFPFATDENAADAGELFRASYNASPQQSGGNA